MDNLITENLRGFKIKFYTRPGVFSRQGLDAGTKLLVDVLQVKDGTMIADLGCGAGVVGFVAAKLNPHGHVHLLDDHLRTINLAKTNTDLNNLKNIEVYLSDLFGVLDHTYHLILSNPPQHMGNEFLDLATGECFRYLKPQGEVWWVVQKHIKPLIGRLFKKYFANCTIVAHGKEHVVLKARKNT